MRYYQVKLDFYMYTTKRAYFEGEIFTENELIKQRFTYRDLKPSKCNIFRVLETDKNNTRKVFGMRKIINPSKVTIIREE